MIKTFQLNNISIEVTKKRIKNLHLRILPPEGRVKISAPIRMSFKFIYDFALSKIDWIQHNQQKIQARKSTKKFSYFEGESHSFLGENYFLKINEVMNKPHAKLEKNTIVLCVKADFCIDKKKALLESWYKETLKEILLSLIAK